MRAPPLSRRALLALGAGAALSTAACDSRPQWLADFFKETPAPARVVLIDTSKSRSSEDSQLYLNAAHTLLRPMFEIGENVDLERNVERVVDGERVLVGALGEGGIGAFRPGDWTFQKRDVYFEDLKSIRKTSAEIVAAVKKLIDEPPLQRKTCIIETLLALSEIFESVQADHGTVDLLLCSDGLESSSIVDFGKVSWTDPEAETEKILTRLRQRHLIARMKGVRAYLVGQGGTLPQVTGTRFFWQQYIAEAGGQLVAIGRSVPRFLA